MTDSLPAAKTPSQPPAFGLLIIGDEILSGKRIDKHLPKVAELLAARGLALEWARCVGDDRARITATLRAAFASDEVVFSCGGIGATPDDHTRQCAAAALDVELLLHPEAKTLIEQRMRDVAIGQGEVFDPQRPDNVHRYNMGVFPAGASVIQNPYNKIPGFSCAGHGGGTVHFLPGFPVMAWPMIESVLDEQYLAWQRPGAWLERSVVVMGAMEAALTPLMEGIEREHEVKVFSLPSVDHPQFGRHIELGVKGEPGAVGVAFAQLLVGLQEQGAQLGPEMVR
jgi:molybdopterin-biosynthesis enzyme MoeA-like protein